MPVEMGLLAADLKTEASTRTIPADEWVLNEITETMDTYGHLFPDAEDLGRGAIDAIFVVALTEQERNQETW